MKADYDYWKKAYETLWHKAGERENTVIDIIGNLSGKKVEKVGFGVGSDEFISGSAKNHGYEKGGADLVVKGTNIYLEVTGPHVKTVSRHDPLWVRPDKIENAKSHSEDRQTWVVHVLESEKLIRVIKLDEEFLNSYKSSKYKLIQPPIRGRVETYIEIPSSDSSIRSIGALIDEIKSS